MAMPTPTRPMPTMALVYFSRPPIVSTVFLGKCNLPRTPRRRCGGGSGPLGIIPRPLGRGFRSGRRVRVTSASDTRARDASRALVWRPVARLLPCTFSRLFVTRLWANLSSCEPTSFFRARRAGGERRAERRALPPKERTMSSSFSALHMDGYVYASPSKRGMSRDDLSDSDDDTQLMDAYNQAVERFREAHDPSGAVAGATALSPGGVGGSRRRQERLDDDAADPSPVAWPRGDQPLVRDDDDDDDRDGHHHDGRRRPPSRSPRTRRVHRETPSPAGGGAMREWNEMSEREREAAWADYYAANGGGDGYQSAGGQQHHQMHRRHHARRILRRRAPVLVAVERMGRLSLRRQRRRRRPRPLRLRRGSVRPVRAPAPAAPPPTAAAAAAATSLRILPRQRRPRTSTATGYPTDGRSRLPRAAAERRRRR